MPLYEYRCSKCHKTFEVIQKFADAPLETHEDCGGHVERLLSAPSFQLKGTGWYITDYGKGGAKDPGAPKSDGSKGASKSGDSGGSAGSAGDAKSDSKSESKPVSEAKSDSGSKSSETKTETKASKSE